MKPRAPKIRTCEEKITVKWDKKELPNGVEKNKNEKKEMNAKRVY